MYFFPLHLYGFLLLFVVYEGEIPPYKHNYFSLNVSYFPCRHFLLVIKYSTEWIYWFTNPPRYRHLEIFSFLQLYRMSPRNILFINLLLYLKFFLQMTLQKCNCLVKGLGLYSFPEGSFVFLLFH